MNFKLNTKPLNDALGLGIVNANISKFYSKSEVAQLTLSANELKINLEAANIATEIKLKGIGEGIVQPITLFVDCVTFKSLVNTIDTNIIELEPQDNSLLVRAGKSKFTLAGKSDESEFTLRTPEAVDLSTVSTRPINKEYWKFVKTHQLFAIAVSEVWPVYNKIYVSEDDLAIIGDLENGTFTKSEMSDLKTTCLLTETTVNMFNAVPDGAVIYAVGEDFGVHVKTDSYELVSQFTPVYESTEDGIDYNVGLILGTFNTTGENVLEVELAAMQKALTQAVLLSTSGEFKLMLEVADNTVKIHNEVINCKVKAKSGTSVDYSMEISVPKLQAIMSHCCEEAVKIAPYESEGEIVGILVDSGDVQFVQAAAE